MNSKVDSEGRKDVIFEQLRQFISEIIGKDVADELNITYNSILTKDLDMGSIEIVSFAEKVNKHYGKKIDFISWLYKMDLKKIVNLSIGSIVDLIYDKIDKSL